MQSKEQRERWEELTNETADGTRLTNRELIDEFAMTIERNPKTKYKYTRNLEELAEWLALRAPDKALLHATRREITLFLAYLKTKKRAELDAARDEAKRRGWKGELSASTRKGYLAAIRELWRYCARMDYTDRDPTFGIECPKVEHSPGLVITQDQLRRFLDAPGRERDRAQAFLLVFTAARANEVRCLLWSDVDFDRREITFRRGKGGKANVVPMHDELTVALRRWQNAQRRSAEQKPALAAALADPDTAFVLLTSSGRQLSHTTIAKQVKWRAARAGIMPHSGKAGVSDENKSKVSPHVLRRSWAYMMRNQVGASLDDIAEVLNHASTDTTRKHYAFASTQKKRRTVQAFAL